MKRTICSAVMPIFAFSFSAIRMRTAVRRSAQVALSSVPLAIQESLRSSILPSILEKNTSYEENPLTVLVGVSGGCDSVGLLHGLMESRVDMPTLDVRVVHFDHQQRGSHSDGDRVFVQKLCDQYNLPFTCYTWDNHLASNATASFSQSLARSWRQEYQEALLSQICTQSQQPGVILTAHHRDDSNESLLLKLIRGAHLKNLHGMKMVKKRGNCWYGRPLLHTTKQDIVDYLQTNDWKWREDASNTSPKYLRNRVRNELMPLLSDLVGGEEVLQRRIDNLVQQSNEIGDDLAQRAEQYLAESSFSNGSFRIPKKWDIATKEALSMWLKRGSDHSSFSYDEVEKLIGQCEINMDRWQLDLSGGWIVSRIGDSLNVRNSDSDMQEIELEWETISENDAVETLNVDSLVLCVPQDLVRGPHTILQTVAEGNNFAIVPPWKNSSVKLNQFLRGQKVPKEARAGSPIIVIETEDKESRELMAVFIAHKQKWVVDQQFATGDDGAEEDYRIIRVKTADHQGDV